MSYLLKSLFGQNGYMNAADGGEGGGAGGGGSTDRGDDWTPTGPDAVQDKDDGQNVSLTDADDKTLVADSKDEDDDKSEDKSEDKDEQSRDEKGRFIPKDRFDEAVRKERGEKEELQRRLKELETKEAQRQVVADDAESQKQLKEMVKQHTSLLADGELDKAADMMEKILDLRGEIADRKAEAKATAAKDAAKEEMRYDALVAKLETDYPQINPDADEFDKTSVKKVQAYMTGLMQTEKMSPSQALKEAVETILGSIKKSADPAKAEDVGMRRKESAVKKAMDAKSKQPASTKEVGLDSDKVGGSLDSSAVMKMSWDEFVKLPDSKLAEMRGDFV